MARTGIEDITTKAALRSFIDEELGTMRERLEQVVGLVAAGRGWAAVGTNSVLAGVTEALENGVKIYDPGGNGSGTSYTVPRAGIYVVLGFAELQNVAVGAEVIMDLLVNGAASGQRIMRDWNGGAAGAAPSGGGHITRAFAKGDVISANVRNGDAATRNIEWRLTVIPLAA